MKFYFGETGTPFLLARIPSQVNPMIYQDAEISGAKNRKNGAGNGAKNLKKS